MTTRLITGESSAFIRKVSSGDMFYACLTDKGILMTFGSGINGCLGYGNYDDAPEVCPCMYVHMLCSQGFSFSSQSWCLQCWTTRR
jgi:hypothetical protein